MFSDLGFDAFLASRVWDAGLKADGLGSRACRLRLFLFSGTPLQGGFRVWVWGLTFRDDIGPRVSASEGHTCGLAPGPRSGA